MSNFLSIFVWCGILDCFTGSSTKGTPVWCVSVSNNSGGLSTHLEDCLTLLPSLCQGHCTWNLTCNTDRNPSTNLIASLSVVSLSRLPHIRPKLPSLYICPPFLRSLYLRPQLHYTVCIHLLSLSRPLYIRP